MSGKRTDYFPANAAKFLDFFENIEQYVQQHKTAWNLPEEQVQTLVESLNRYKSTLYTCSANPTSANRLARNEAQGESTRVIRAFVNRFLRFEPVSDADRVEMRLPVRDTVRTTHVEVREHVSFTLHTSGAKSAGIRSVTVDFWQQGLAHKSKPKGYTGAAVIWGVMELPPHSTDELTHHALASRRPFTLQLNEQDRGKKVWIAMAWQNRRGIRGSWSRIESAIIP